MKLEESFEVDAPVEEVWKALIDVQRVAPCLPGAEITDAGEDGTYEGNFQVKLGPTTAAYRGTLKLQSVDEQTHTATMDASGRDKRGQGSAKATMVSRVTEAEGGSARVHVDTDFTITGRLARFGRGGMIHDVSRRLLGDFAACLQEEIGSSRGAPADAGTGATADGSAAASAPSPAGAAAPAAPEPTPTGTGAPAAPGASTAPAPSGTGSTPGTGDAGRGAAAAARPQRRSEPVKGFSLLLSVLRDRIRRLFSRRSDAG